ncbi:MAG: exodeoxyribonuclease VII small subunit [Parvularcula sp.]
MSKTDIGKMSFEAALAELEEIIAKLEGGTVELEESITLYERGAALRAHCDKKLKSAREKIEKVVAQPDGSVAVEPAAFE